jgi:predicted Fe-S protein YdhL (DUF1289 family)
MCGSELTPKPQGLSATDRHLLSQAQRIGVTGDVIASPCVSVCRMSDDTQLCEGCWRSLEEIAFWSQADVAYKRQVWRHIAQRIEQRQQS